MLGGDVGTIDGCIVGGSDSASTRGAHQSSASAEVRQRGRGRRTTTAVVAIRRRARSSGRLRRRATATAALAGRGRAGGPLFGGSTVWAASVVIYRLIRMFASLRYRAGRPRAAGSVYAPRFMVIGLHSLLSLCVKSAVCAVRNFRLKASMSPAGALAARFGRVGTGGEGYRSFLVSYMTLAN